MNESANEIKNVMLVLAGAVVGGALGYFGFFWLVQQGFYGLVLPGGLLGLGAGVGKTKWRWISVVCGLLALGLGVFSEWRLRPFVANNSLGYFLAHLNGLQPLTMTMIAAGALIGFWVPFSRSKDVKRTSPADPAS